MKLYRIGIKMLSGSRTPMHSDTLFGSICWAVLYLEERTGSNSCCRIAKRISLRLYFRTAFHEDFFRVLPAGITPQDFLKPVQNQK